MNEEEYQKQLEESDNKKLDLYRQFKLKCMGKGITDPVEIVALFKIF